MVLLLARGRDRLETLQGKEPTKVSANLLLARGRDRLETGLAAYMTSPLLPLLLARGRDRLETGVLPSRIKAKYDSPTR